MPDHANKYLVILYFTKIVFNLQISIPRVHPVRILGRSDYCITTDIMLKTKTAP